MLNQLMTRGSALRRPLRPLLRKALQSWPCLATWRACLRKRHLLLATLVALVMTAFVPWASADLYVISENTNSVLRFDEATGQFMDVFVSPGSGGLNDPRHLLIGRDGNLYLTSFNNNSVMRYDGTTG